MSGDEYDRHEASYVLASIALSQQRLQRQVPRERRRGMDKGKKARQPIGASTDRTRRKP